MKGFITFSALLLLTTCFSCRKVIKVDLNSSSPRYVIEGNVTDQPGPYHVSITKSVNFDQDNNFPGVSNAQVVITDVTSNITDTLTEESTGYYTTHFITGVQGHTYSLSVASGSNVFQATSTIPPAVRIDGIYTEKALFGDNPNTVLVFNDPVGTGNYYHMLLSVGDSTSTNLTIIDDALQDGHKVLWPLRSDIKIVTGDTITVEFQCIDKRVFQFYRDLQLTEGQNSAAPANPQSNISGGALGYFSAHTVDRMKVVAP